MYCPLKAFIDNIENSFTKIFNEDLFNTTGEQISFHVMHNILTCKPVQGNFSIGIFTVNENIYSMVFHLGLT